MNNDEIELYKAYEYEALDNIFNEIMKFIPYIHNIKYT